MSSIEFQLTPKSTAIQYRWGSGGGGGGSDVVCRILKNGDVAWFCR